MAKRAVSDLSAGRLAGAVVPAIVAGFDRYQAVFMGITGERRVASSGAIGAVRWLTPPSVSTCTGT